MIRIHLSAQDVGTCYVHSDFSKSLRYFIYIKTMKTYREFQKNAPVYASFIGYMLIPINF